jgi:hypothetical protein
MTSLQAIEAAVEKLDPAGRARIRAWFERFDAADWLAEEALADLKVGRCHER